MALNNEHISSGTSIGMVKRMVRAGIPQKLIARSLDISETTLVKHYKKYLNTSHHEAIEEVATVAFNLALEGNEKMIALLLKTQGHKYGFVEKQVLEQQEAAEIEELKGKVAEYEAKHIKEY